MDAESEDYYKFLSLECIYVMSNKSRLLKISLSISYYISLNSNCTS